MGMPFFRGPQMIVWLLVSLQSHLPATKYILIWWYALEAVGWVWKLVARLLMCRNQATFSRPTGEHRYPSRWA